MGRRYRGRKKQCARDTGASMYAVNYVSSVAIMAPLSTSMRLGEQFTWLIILAHSVTEDTLSSKQTCIESVDLASKILMSLSGGGTKSAEHGLEQTCSWVTSASNSSEQVWNHFIVRFLGTFVLADVDHDDNTVMLDHLTTDDVNVLDPRWWVTRSGFISLFSCRDLPLPIHHYQRIFRFHMCSPCNFGMFIEDQRCMNGP